MEGSWERPEPKESALDSLLGALRRIPRQFSAVIGANWIPKWTPGGDQNEVPNRSLLKMPKSLKLVHSTQDLNDFRGPSGSLWVLKCGPKRGPKWDLDAEDS